MGSMPFRQIHLDFHTSEKIPGVGSRFDKKQFQHALQIGHVNSINIFAKCHHGWLYYLNGVTPSHPSLKIDLLKEMLEACEEIGVKNQIYISAGLDERVAINHPEWLVRDEQQRILWAKDFTEAGYHLLCMNTPYLDHLVKQVKEVVERFDTTGIWLDIVGVRPCHCQICMNQLIKEGKDPRDEKAVLQLGERVFKHYLETIEKTVHDIKPDMPIFQNSGHIIRGRRDIIKYYSHIELESLPTGGWGYDHFPLSARYVQGLGKEYLGMTGKFHNTWGEFGGFKHPNALRYEAALNLANGAKVCVGDQMHPTGEMDEVTYKLIGEAYKEVEQKEQWCNDVENIADVGLLSVEALQQLASRDESDIGKSDSGAVRMLLEGKYLFDVLDLESDFNKYKVIILPDEFTINAKLESKLKDFINKGGKILATGKSGLNSEETKFALDFGVDFDAINEYRPDYFVPKFSYHGLGSTSFVMYGQGIKINLKDESSIDILGERENPYFNRDLLHFCSHQHTPNEKGNRSPGMVAGKAGIYIAWKVFNDYATKGSLVLKDMVKYALDYLLKDSKTLKTSLGEQGIATVQHQINKNRYINHLLYASPVRRGENVEVIEDILPIYNVDVEIRIEKEVKNVYLAPELKEIPFIQEGNKLKYTIDKINCHQMVVIEY